jgi:ribose-phosphate pyrophosphokinase
VSGKTAIIVDDIIATGGTTVQGARSLKDAGATSVFVMTTHGVLAGNAVENLTQAPIEEVIVTNSIDIPREKRFGKLRVISIAPVIADAISTLVR